MSNKKRILYDVLLATLLIAIAACAYLITEALREDGAVVRVYVNGEAIAEYSLSSDGEYPILAGKNLLVISDGRAYMLDADCPDRLCVNQGSISRTGECITCLPNRVVVEVIGAGEEIFVTQ